MFPPDWVLEDKFIWSNEEAILFARSHIISQDDEDV